ncbi:MAG TPA: DNA mismatch repair endonuclease MutL [Terriglobia bacterium]|nr:DNA mismatch repair endonuclease MutL [Terriglobia bacterium]
MTIIRILPEAIANKIAAGEVVERPASIVKELLENSLDAQARRLDLAVEAGGKRLIRLEDDGVGMTRDDAMLSFERHATSKIKTIEDLFEVSTLGFRGEALPSIAAVSRVSLETRHASEPAGTQIEIAGSRMRDVREIPRAPGTRMEVRDVFFNTPARRKFLKSESTELGHTASLVTHYALAHPEIAFRLSSLTNEVLNVSPVGSYRDRIYQVMGPKTLDQLVEIPLVERPMPIPVTGDGEEEWAAPDPVVVRLSGFVSRPEVQRLNRNQIYFFVNRRLVRDRLILHAIQEAYRNILPPAVFPVALIFIELPAREVDVNVHPAKTEVRFRHSGFIHDFARDSIRRALIASKPIESFPMSRGRSSFLDDLSREIDAVATERLAEELALPPSPVAASVPDPEKVSEADLPLTPVAPAFQLSPPHPPPETLRLPLQSPPFAGESHNPISESMRAARSESEIHSLSTSSTPEPGNSKARSSEFPLDLFPLGQVRESFIIATNSEGLWIIDQHVAHERILFERHLKQRREQHVEGQRLLLPIIVELQPQQLATYREIGQELAANGFEVEPFGQRTLAIKTAPADIRAGDAERLLIEILDGIGPEARAISLEALRGKIAASVACHAAIKINTALDFKKMQWLIRELSRTDCPMACPHGRPIVLRYSLREIEKAFKRT